MPTSTEQQQKIETLDVFWCQQPLNTGGKCDDVATYRVRKGSLAVTFCASHAKRYLSGEDVLEAVKCLFCRAACKPGYLYDEESGESFCRETCRQSFYGNPGRAY